MAIAHLISAEEYLHTSFEHDAEYVDGRIVYRSVPQKPHSKMQRFLLSGIAEAGGDLGLEAWPEQRIRTQANPPHFRVPDVCVTYGEPDEDVFTTPPFLCIEILSPDDSLIELRIKISEYLNFGVEYVWVIDPVARSGEVYTRDRIESVRDGKFKAGPIEVDLAKSRR
jgi:Uma2 family endonuclease